MRNRTNLIIASFLLVLGILGPAAARAENVIPEKLDPMDEGLRPGWHPLLKFSGNFALQHSESIPGNADGLNVNFGYLLNGGLDFVSENKQHEWTNVLSAQLGYARTPIVDSWLKSVDAIDFQSIYRYRIPAVPWLGPFVSFKLKTHMLPGYEVRTEDTRVLRLETGEEQQFDAVGNLLDEDGNPVDARWDRLEEEAAGSKISLTPAFAPLTLRESVGMFAMPVNKQAVKLDIRLGFGAWETFVRDSYVLEDNEDTSNILELRALQDYVQIGPELGVDLSGMVVGRFDYRLSASFMQPIYHTAETDLEGVDLMNMEFEAVLSAKLWDWASLDYSLKAYKQPLIVDDWQIQNTLLLTVTFTIVKPEDAPQEEPCDCPPVTCPETASKEASAAPAGKEPTSTTSSEEKEAAEQTEPPADEETAAAPAEEEPAPEETEPAEGAEEEAD